jgi:mannose-6-phosphate isomerase-like protein (cupin superfamily)
LSLVSFGVNLSFRFTVAAAPGDWIKYGPRDEWVPYAEAEGYEASGALAFYMHKDAMSETLVLEVASGSAVDFHNQGYFGRRSISVLSGTINFYSNESTSSVKSGGLLFVPAMNPFALQNTGNKPAYVSLSTIFYTI